MLAHLSAVESELAGRSAGGLRMTSFPTPYAAARIAAFLDEHLSWSAWWDKRYGLWRVAEDDTDSDLYAESQDADVVIRYMRAHSRDASRQPMG